MRRQQLLLLVAWTLLILLVTVSTVLFHAMQTLTACGQQEQQMNQQLAHTYNDFLALKQQSANMRIEIELLKETVTQFQEKQAIIQELKREKQSNVWSNSSSSHNSEKTSNNQKNQCECPEKEPSLEYEQTRRQIIDGVKEMWYFFGSALKNIETVTSDPNITDVLDILILINNTLLTGIDHKRSLLRLAQRLADVDGYAEWREKEASDLHELVKMRLDHIQNPLECSKAKKIVCKLNLSCGFGCQFHYVVFCMLMAYGSQRTFVIESKNWKYHSQGYEEVFLPLSKNCTDAGGANRSIWPGQGENTQVLDLPVIGSLQSRPSWLPLKVPKDLAPRLARLHGDPIVWWVGQLIAYVMRPQDNLAALLEETERALGFQSPVVGVHIRRTDKIGTEASFHSLKEYMDHVEEYFNQLDLIDPVVERRVYIASDDPSVLQDAKIKYPNYTFIGDADIANSAALATRYTDNSLLGILVDFFFLSKSDYLVCTLSSQICRGAYEAKQVLYPDAADRIHSLDDVYFFAGQESHDRVVVMDHTSQFTDEIDLRVGDQVGVAGNHWDGYSLGRNKRTNKEGLFPSNKVIDVVQEGDYPNYSELAAP